jgi:hypothetical protein
MQMHGASELIVDYKSPQGATVSEVRGSLIASSLTTIRERGLFERYVQHLPPTQRDNILYVLAASWVPLDLAMTHYEACDAMGLGDSELDELGNHVAQRIMGTFLGTLVRSARHVATSIPLGQYSRLWERLLVGGSCSVHMLGMKDARIESRGVPMFRYRYFRSGYLGLVRGASLMFRTAAFTRLRRASNDSLTMELNWV